MDVLLVFQIITTIYFGVFGLIIGSFLNVCIYRIPAKKTIVKGHSMCMSCGHVLGALDLVPLFSWIFLKGKCRYCASPIASRYAKIEGLTGFVFALLAWQRKESFYLPGASTEAIIKFISLILLMALTSVIIVAMMIQKDQGTGMFRFSASVLLIIALRVILSVFDPASLIGVVKSGLIAFLMALGLLALIIILSPFTRRSPRVFFNDIFTGKSVRGYFASSNRASQKSDLLFLVISAAVGFPAAVLCLFAYGAVRCLKKQDALQKYFGIILAASSFLGILIFPGMIF